MNRQDDGFALIAVLGLMLMLSIIALGIIQYAEVGARAASGERQRVSDKYLGFAALAQYEHEVIADARARSKAGGDHTMKVLGKSITLMVENENSRLNISRASQEEIIKYMVTKEIDEKDAEQIAAKVLDWRDSDNLKRPNGGEAIDYGLADVRPRNSPFESVGEMKYLDATQEALDNFNGFTIYSHTSGGQKITGSDIMGRSLGVARIQVSVGDYETSFVARLLPSANHSIRVLKYE